MVKVRMRFRQDEDDSLPDGESMWATPLRADDGGGTYRLENSSFFAPLRVGDVVRAELDGYSCLQVVGIDVLEPGPLSYVEYPEEEATEVVKAVADSWAGQGATWSEGMPPFLVTAWGEEVTAGQVRQVLAAGIRPGWRVQHVLDLGERREWAEDVIDFELDRSAPPSVETVDYWAADDAEWSRLGVVEPERLAYLQVLAAEDPRVLATIRAGRHADVLTYVERLQAPDPRVLPPLDGPLLVDPDEG